jgi:xylulose-5-phosphate/fructose-6-phosphate phosphoketolase
MKLSPKKAPTDPRKPEHIKNKLLWHWGTSPGQNFIYAHLNRIIHKYDLNTHYISGPGHGGPALVADSGHSSGHE